MTDEESMQFLSSLPNYEQQSPSARDLTLEPICGLLALLGNPHHRLFVVHVAGSKGKGSVAAMLGAILRHAGYRTGVYTSPQLTCLEERIRVNGTPITRPAMAALISNAQRALANSAGRGDRTRGVTFFDVLTALAFAHFESERVDVAIIEVGMGGRTDSTNVCHPRLAIITSISYDHTKQLGNTLTAIATEKAGIIKPGCPTVSGELPDEARDVITATCEQQGSPLKQLHSDFTYRYTPGEVSRSTINPSRVLVTTRGRTWPEIHLNLLGEHQAANAALAVAAVERLQEAGLSIHDEAVVGALARVQWPARIETFRQAPLVILDCAHNTASVHALVRTLLTCFPDYMGSRQATGTKKSLLFGASRDKDLVGMLTILAPHFDRLYLTQYTSSARCASTDTLLAASRRSGIDRPTVAVPDPVRAWQLVRAEASRDDLICVTGSVFLAGELRPVLLNG
jgi:dihydrofolate synthase/folylpolyglutamate synthase